MESTDIIIVALAGGLAVFVLVFLITSWTSTTAQRNCTGLAKELGIEFKRKPRSWLPQYAEPFLEGVIHGRHVLINTYRVGTGNSQQTWCQLIVAVTNSRGLTFTISERTVFSGVAQLFSSSVMKTGDENFDGRFVVKTNAPEFMQAALFPEMRKRIAEVCASEGLTGNVVLARNELKYQERGSFLKQKSCRHIASAVKLLLDLATLPDAHNDLDA